MSTTTTPKKITMATIKSFIRKNREGLFILTGSRFDAMEDGCRGTGQNEFSPALEADRNKSNCLGVHGAWFVLRGRDYFTAYEDANFTGYIVDNCCGHFTLAVRK